LKLQFLPGKINTYYSEGAELRAKELKILLERAAPFLEDSLKVKIGVTMAAVTAKEWAFLLDKPYGLPTMRFGACKRSSTRLPEVKYAAIMPGAVNGPIYNGWIELKDSLSPSTLKKLAEAGVAFEQGGKILIDFVGLHELGHAYANAFGLKNYVNFFAEFITNYLAYAFLRSTEERLDKKVMAILSANVDGITPIHSSLKKWEGFRSAEHPPTETWYNSIITLKAAEIYEQRGFEFLYAVRKAFPEEEGKLNTETIIARLDSIHPGIFKWSENLSKKIPQNTSLIIHDSTLLKVKALNTPFLKKDIDVYYSAGYKKRGKKVQSLIQDAMRFYRKP
jgi:hypothetical protein